MSTPPRTPSRPPLAVAVIHEEAEIAAVAVAGIVRARTRRADFRAVLHRSVDDALAAMAQGRALQ